MTIAPQDENRRLNSPPLQGRGRGWGLSANAAAVIADHATALRNNPTEPERRLWSRLRGAQLGGYKFRRQARIGRYIADFACPAIGLIVELDGDTHDAVRDARRDAECAMLGYQTIRFANIEMMQNLDGVLRRLLDQCEGMPPRRVPHPNPSPEGEGQIVSPVLG